MEYFYLSTFKSEIKKLKKKKANNKISQDLILFLNDKTKDQLTINSANCIIKDQYFSLYKFRFKNSISGKGKSGGYRLYVAFSNSNDDILILCCTYPKSGSLAKASLTSKEEQELLKSISTDIDRLENLEDVHNW